MMQTIAHTTLTSEHKSANHNFPPEWQILDDVQCDDVVSAVARDTELGIAVAKGAPATFRIWQNAQALIASRLDAMRPRFAEARHHMQQQGWPVVIRPTGGSAIPHRHGILNLSMLLPRSAGAALSLVHVYQMLCLPIQTMLDDLGIGSYFSSVQNSFCDGQYNLVAAGRKIAGTAQSWRANIARGKHGREGYILAHASLFVDVDSSAVTDAVRRFYSLLGEDRQLDPHSIITVRDCLEHNQALNGSTNNLLSDIRTRLFAVLANQHGANAVMVDRKEG